MKFSPLEHTVHFQLPNGLRVYLKPDRRAPLVSAQAWVQVGSVDEPESESGLSHVLEHMLFKGTARYKAEEISRWIEALGGSLNAETSREYTRYYIDVPAHGAHEAVTLLSELLFRATFDPVEWQRECPVILEEMKRRNDDPEAMLWDIFNEALYDDVRLRQPVIGYPKTVEAVTPEILRNFYKRHYAAKRTVVVVAGDFKAPEMKRWIERAFAEMPSAGDAREPFPQEKFFKPSSRKKTQPVHQSYVAFGFPTPSSDHEDQETLDLLAAILSDGRGSRLVDRLRETKKVVWSVNAFNLTHSGPGLFGILFECDAARREAATEELYRVLRGLRRRPPVEYELRRAKNLLQTSWLQGYETYHHQAATIGSFAVDGNLERLKNYLPRLLSIKTTEIQRVIEKYFGSLHLSNAMVEAP